MFVPVGKNTFLSFIGAHERTTMELGGGIADFPSRDLRRGRHSWHRTNWVSCTLYLSLLTTPLRRPLRTKKPRGKLKCEPCRTSKKGIVTRVLHWEVLM